MTHILIVDDDLHIRQLIKAALRNESFTVSEAVHGAEAIEAVEQAGIDLIILDIMMPVMDGWIFCRRLKEIRDIPIIMVTAQGEVTQRIRGFQLGADDYIVKPFDPMELVMRVKALLKRCRIEHAQTVQLNELIIDRSMQEIQVGDKHHLLPLKEFELLFKLASFPGQIFTRDQLIEQIWGAAYDGDERTVDVHVRRLRERLESLTDKVVISTVRGLGYRLEVQS